MSGAEPFDLPQRAASAPPPAAPRLPLVGSLACAALALVAAAVGTAGLSLVAYALALIGGTGLLGWHRWADGRASQSTDYVPVRWLRRLAVAAAVLIVVACAANAFVWATEVSKQ